MKVTRIAAKTEGQKKRVAAYCRVSTLKDDQEESFETQERFYRNFIQNNPDWIFAGVYGDPGLSAVKADTRPQFQQMIRDAEKGNINLILCKSISRFSRNIVDCRRYTDRLRNHDVYVRYEKEKVTTSDPSADLIFTLLSAVAQSESQSLSDNVRWAHQERMKRGQFNLGSNRILGYDTVDGKLTPNRDAEIIREIFRRFVAGEGYKAIADSLNAEGHKTLRGHAFRMETIRRIVRNETYVGDKLLQKQAPINLLTKKPDPSKPYDSYYVTNDHERIIDRKTWEAAEAIIEQRAEENRADIYRKGKEHHAFYGKVFCGLCGAPLLRRTFQKGVSGGKPVNYKAWVCRKKQKGGCTGKAIQEKYLMQKIQRTLGWENFEEEAFSQTVKKAIVFPDRIMIETIGDGPIHNVKLDDKAYHDVRLRGER